MSKDDLTREERIKKEKQRLTKIFKNIPKDKKDLCTGLISNAAYMHITLEDLQMIVNSEGAVTTGINGNGFETTNEHPAQRCYNTTLDKYVKTMKALTDLLPDNVKGEQKKAGEELAKFVAKGKPKGVK